MSKFDRRRSVSSKAACVRTIPIPVTATENRSTGENGGEQGPVWNPFEELGRNGN